MKIIIESQDDRIEISDKLTDIHGAMALFRRTLIALGFHPDTIKRGFESASKDEN